MQLGAFIMTYRRQPILQKTLETLLSQTRPPDHILIVDNEASPQTQRLVQGFPSHLVTYAAMSANLGPAGAAAYGIEWFSKQNYEWIYWGDDDDPPEFPDVLERLLQIAMDAKADVAAVGAVGARFDWRRGESVRLSDEVLQGILEVDSIGGGKQLLLRTDAVRKTGLPDSRLFFGYEEREYCHRLQQAGYRLLVDGDLMLRHRENAGRLNLSLSRALVSRHQLHEIWRQYYCTRNHIFMMQHTFHHANLARREAVKALVRALLSWRRGPQYGYQFTRLQLQAVADGYGGRMGCTVLPRGKS